MRIRSVNCRMKFYPVVFALFFAGCSDNGNLPSSETVHTGGDTLAKSTISFIAGCYQQTNGDDTTTITLTLKDSIVLGTEVHKLKQGQLIETYEFHGTISDSILSAYVSTNGKEYYRNTFLIKNDSLLPSEWIVMPGPGQDGLSEYSVDKAYVRVACKQ